MSLSVNAGLPPSRRGVRGRGDEPEPVGVDQVMLIQLSWPAGGPDMSRTPTTMSSGTELPGTWYLSTDSTPGNL